MPALSPRPLPSRAATPPELLRDRVAADGARPLLTYYDDATGERVELSATTTANWVAKTANLVQDELGIGAGARVAVDLPAHWLGAVWVLACWALGATVVVDAGAGSVDLAVATPDRLRAAVDRAGEVVAVPLSSGPVNLPGGVLDYGSAVRAQGDLFSAWTPPDPATPALENSHTLHTQGGLVDLARERASALRLGARPRVLVDASPAGLPGARDVLLVPLVTAGSAVLVRHGDPGRDADRRAAERVTADLRG